ncbi:unnamed protein product [Ectocarpus sp. CCAP 1310/34]|nr:unnamed protein product [Ectocarpus sp. CCAP 1310/34]
MGDGEKPSWLGSMIDQVDRLALKIGGYEEPKPPGNGFSDDESDSNSTNSGSSSEDEDSGDSGFEDTAEDDDDSGFEDAGPSPVLKTRTEYKEEAAEGGDAPQSDDLEPMKPEQSSKQIPPVSIADNIPSLSVRRSQTSQENCDENDVQGSEEKPLGKEYPQVVSSGDNAPLDSATSSRSEGLLTKDDVPVLEGDLPRPQGDGNSPRQPLDVVGDVDSTFSTPAHSRDRDALRKGPPLDAVPVASSAGSRRVNREKKNNEGLNAKSPMNTQILKDAGHVSPSGAPRLPGSKKKKNFSYVSDTTWIKPKEELAAETSSPPLELASRAAVTGGHAPSQVPPARKPLASDCAAAEATEGAAEVDQSSTPRRNRHRPPREKDHGLKKADTDFPMETRPEEPLHVRAEDGKSNGGRMPVTEEIAEAVALAHPEGRPAPDETVTTHLPEDQADANGLEEPHERENGTGHARAFQEGGYQEEARQGIDDRDEVEPGIWNEGVATIGAKRMSSENGMGSPAEEWILDSPEGFAPSKRGKLQSEHPLAVMRHSARLDDAIFERQRMLGAITAGSGSDEDVAKKAVSDGSKGLESGDGDELAAVPWPDRALRPYDPPIVDTDLPARQAKALGRLGMGSQTVIVCSPFRRCLQTAGVVARTLGVASVTVHLQVGERMDKVRKEIAELALDSEERSDGTLATKEAVPAFSYLEEADMRAALGAGVQLERIIGEQPPEEESGIEAKQRFIATIAKVREEQLRDSPVLVVAHGDTLDAAGESLASQIVFEGQMICAAMYSSPPV